MQALMTPFSHLFSVGPTGQATFGTPLRSLLDCHLGRSPTPGSGPIQRALLYDPNVPYDQNTKKYEHLGEAEQREFPVNDGPREKENGLNVENYEKNRNDVITDRVTLPRVRIRVDAALVRHELALTAGLRTDQFRDEQSHDRKKKRQCHENKDGYVSRQC